MNITIDQLKQHFGNTLTDAQLEQAHRLMAGTLDPMTFPGVEKWVAKCYNRPGSHDLIMEALNEVLQAHGVEDIASGSDSPWNPVKANYINMGDTYSATILYLPGTGEYLLTSWGDYVESLGHEDE